jgi:hypothetical protein
MGLWLRRVPPRVAAGQGEKTWLSSGLEVAAVEAQHRPGGWKAPPFCWALTQGHSGLRPALLCDFKKRVGVTPTCGPLEPSHSCTRASHPKGVNDNVIFRGLGPSSVHYH